ncbi:phosphoglycerate mutase family protein [Cucurbitaria berberidis CBS 394.84]|uniref:Phosphoglycerate mutase family protein n=1 Tax=Cucurbitaria berberidis CBS 394.84 TaxID=1168544 RepID=A0A9P4GPE4_9PLEO|nr:phosphoglycerate mutase family protein [Cucurbitaria berberidis CBS 394.84]KAF1848904.1 phosphoglycerate mutase family protein [Cucurbitaria berberidis CBS 394.84]
MASSTQIPAPAEPPHKSHFKYTVQKGYFLQSEDSTDDKEFDFRKSNFGLINRGYDTDHSAEEAEEQWKRFERYVRTQNESAKDGEFFKVLFLGRHGQGWHNVAETKYGTEAWDCYWSALDGADGIIWADANLTSTGQEQAKDVRTLWKQQLPHGIPPPETYYVSPLTRTIETADLSFQELDLPPGKEYKPFIKELLREALGVHTCDRRSAKSVIEKNFPHVTFEPGFSEDDELWEADYREPRTARRYRLALLLDDVFANDENVFLSLTAHSGAIASILEVFGHRAFALETGGVIPVLVKAEKVRGEREKPPKEPSAAPPLCDKPPQ